MNISMFEPKVTKWLLKPEGRFSEPYHNLLNFGLNLSPPDPNKPNVCYYTVMPDYRLVCNSTKDYIFQFELETVYEIENNGQKPTPELLFEIAKQNTIIMNAILKDKSKNNSIHNHVIPDLDYYHIYPDLIQIILRSFG